MPIHNGTLDLSMRPWTEPFDRISALAMQQDVPLVTPRLGERLDVSQPGQTEAWWHQAR
ncbi:MAG: hypothetical protein K0U79_01615 [Gammaproteobacteria bacterium]|jgi:hypothetical protein|nr:hypothetical protein [Gammaproteobacteria bacterium]